MLRRLVLLVVALLAAGLVTAVPALAAGPTITDVTPASGPVGTQLTIAGTGFNGTVRVTVAGVNATGVRVVSARKVLAKVPLSASGPVRVTADGGTATGPTFTVTPGLQLGADVVRPGVGTNVSGSGFGANEAVDVYLDGASAAIAVADAAGIAAVRVTTTRATPPGAHIVTAVGRRTGSAAQTTLTVRTDWASPGFDTGRTGVNPFESQVTPATLSGLTERWRVDYGQPVNAAPVVAGGIAYLHSYFDLVAAVDVATGTELWSVDLSTGSSGFAALVVANGLVYAGASDGVLHALDALTGVERWQYTTSGAITDAPAVVNGRVFLPSRGGTLTALDALTGAFSWVASAGGTNWFSTPTVVGNFLYLGSTDNTVRRMAVTGGTGWVLSVTGTPYSAPLVADGRVFFGTSSGIAYAVSAANGALLWSPFAVGSGSVTQTPGLVGDQVIFTNTGSVVTAVEYTTGSVTWSQSGANVSGWSGVASVNGIAFVSSATRTLAYDARTGAILRRFSLGAIQGGVVVTDGAMYGYDYTDRALVRYDLG